jgi:nitroreductase
MEFNEVIGTRRTIRFFDPERPVEPEKIQIMLEAANRASRSVQGDFCRAVVVRRDEISDEIREALKTPTTTVQFDLAPVAIFWYGSDDYVQTGQDRLKELVDLNALPPTHGWSHQYVDEVAYTQVVKPLHADPTLNLWMVSVETGLQIAQAMLAAVDQGLGVGLSAFNIDVAKDLLKVPDDLIPMWVMFVGYPAEDPKAEGQRPRRPLSRNYFTGTFATPFEEDPAVTERLKAEKMIQEPGVPDDPARKAEIRQLAERFGLPL